VPAGKRLVGEPVVHGVIVLMVVTATPGPILMEGFGKRVSNRGQDTVGRLRGGVVESWNPFVRVSAAPAAVLAVLMIFPVRPAMAAEQASPGALGSREGAEAKAPQEEVNTGQDPTRPVTRLDLRLKYVELDHKAVGGDSAQVLTLRSDLAVPLRGGWRLALRGEFPMSWDDTPSADNPGGARQFGLSDTLFQGALITPTAGNWTAAFGTQVIFPTATRAQMGTGKFQLVPSAVVKYDLGSRIPGVWTALLVRHAVDVGEVQANRPSVNQTIVQPYLNFDLPREWYLTFAPELRYDWRAATWFIPFDVEIGKMVTRHVVLSVQYDVGIVKDLPLYKQQVEFRIGYFF
jgi:hypothetical protein